MNFIHESPFATEDELDRPEPVAGAADGHATYRPTTQEAFAAAWDGQADAAGLSENWASKADADDGYEDKFYGDFDDETWDRFADEEDEGEHHTDHDDEEEPFGAEAYEDAFGYAGGGDGENFEDGFVDVSEYEDIEGDDEAEDWEEVAFANAHGSEAEAGFDDTDGTDKEDFLPSLFDPEVPGDGPDFEGEDPLPTSDRDGWVVPADILRIGQSHPPIRYDDAPPWNDNKKQCTGSLTSGARKLSNYIKANFDGVRRIGGYNCRRNTARTSKTSIHGTGRALDIMIPTVGGRADSSAGDPIARWLIVHAPAIGIQYFIWNNVQWNGRRGKFSVYITEAQRRRGTGKSPHRDHLHVELNEDAAAERTPWFGANKVLLDNIFDYQRASARNRHYARSLGWDNRRGDIAQWLGLGTRTPSESAFIDAVRKFQARERLEADGTIGPKTWAAIQRAFNSPAQGPSIDVDQAERLNARHSASLGWDGRLADIAAFLKLSDGASDGAGLARAIAAWQATQGLKVDGIMGPKTWARMRPQLGRGQSPAPRPSGPTSSAGNSRGIGGAVRKKIGGWGGWRGQATGGTAKVSASAIGDKYELAVAVAAQVESNGYYDVVQMYDRGILSWGIKQWTLHRGSLQNLLRFIRSSLDRQGQGALWSSLFPDLDMQGRSLVVNGRTYATPRKDGDAADLALRKVFRGSTSKTSFDKAIMDRWLDIFARAGRHPAIQRLMLQYAVEDLKSIMNRDLGGILRRRGDATDANASNYGRVGDYVEADPLALTLFNGMETQNPKYAFRYLRNTINAFAKKHGTYDIARWPANWQTDFSKELNDAFAASGFACWGTRAKNTKQECRERTTRTDKLLAAYRALKSG